MRETELVFTGSMKVQAHHDNCGEGTAHRDFHVQGGLDVVTLSLGNSVRLGDMPQSERYLPPLPADVYAGGCSFQETVVVVGNADGLTITAGALGLSPNTSEGVNAAAWFDILVGSELAYVRRSLAGRALSTTDPVRQGRYLDIPASAIDRLADQIWRSHREYCI